MAPLKCGIKDCGAAFDAPRAALAHQIADHEEHECRICGASVPAGFFAIAHAVDEHTRAEYVRRYDADADAIRRRERVKERIEEWFDEDADAIRGRLAAEESTPPVGASAGAGD